MELRVLRYFLTAVREKSIVGAAEALHLTQPTLSRQLRALEQEFGARLFERGNRSQHLRLTEKGMLLRRRAEEMLELAEKTSSEMLAGRGGLSGEISIGCGESAVMRLTARAACRLRQKHPGIRFRLYSGNSVDVREKLDGGLVDFGVLIDPGALEKYNTIRLPESDVWGLLVRRDSPLARRKSAEIDDLPGLPLIVSRQSVLGSAFEKQLGMPAERLNIVATYNLLYNAALLVEEGMGYALCIGCIINTRGLNIVFVPLRTAKAAGLFFVWKKYQPLSQAAAAFLEEIEKICGHPGVCSADGTR